MKTPRVIRLIDVICAAYDKWVEVDRKEEQDGTDPGPGNDVTHCNNLVQDVAAEFGYAKFKGLRANQITDILEADQDWLKVPPEAAQFHANEGGLVIAAWKNPDPSLSGHVAPVRPGEAEPSKAWGKLAPKVANIGKENRIGQKASWSFSQEPAYYVLKATID